jgi:hypothetical protein
MKTFTLEENLAFRAQRNAIHEKLETETDPIKRQNLEAELEAVIKAGTEEFDFTPEELADLERRFKNLTSSQS